MQPTASQWALAVDLLRTIKILSVELFTPADVQKLAEAIARRTRLEMCQAERSN